MRQDDEPTRRARLKFMAMNEQLDAATVAYLDGLSAQYVHYLLSDLASGNNPENSVHGVASVLPKEELRLIFQLAAVRFGQWLERKDEL